MDKDPNPESAAWFLVEAHFLMSGPVNSKNNLLWGSFLSQHFIALSVQWVAILKNKSIEPFWFEAEKRCVITVNSELYLKVL